MTDQKNSDAAKTGLKEAVFPYCATEGYEGAPADPVQSTEAPKPAGLCAPSPFVGA